MYIRVLKLLLGVTGLLKKNDLVIYSIMKETIGFEGVEKLAIRSAIEPIMGPKTRLVIGLERSSVTGPEIEPTTKPATKLKNIKKFSIRPTTGSVGPKKLLLS